MATEDDVRRIALSLPETSEAADHFGFGVLSKGKQRGFAWAWNERTPTPGAARRQAISPLASSALRSRTQRALQSADE